PCPASPIALAGPVRPPRTGLHLHLVRGRSMPDEYVEIDRKRPISPTLGRGNPGRSRTITPMTCDLAVVICTRDRPELLRRAIAAIAAQTFPGSLQTARVFG